MEQIGHGKFGRVFKVQNKKNKKTYAAKIFDQCRDFNDLKSFINEVEISIEANCESIIRIHGFSFNNFEGEQMCPTFIMDLAEKNTLSKILQNERENKAPSGWNATKKLINIYGIVLGMRYLHRHGILHRDLKPDNIVLDSHYYPKITDFGVSKIFENDILQTNSFVTTPLYMAPEILNSKPYSFKADVYAFSFILYEIFSNQAILSVFPCQTLPQLMAKVTSGERPPIKYIKYEDQIELLKNCWSDNPDERYSFDQIYEYLENHPNIIHSPVDQQEFQNYLLKFDEILEKKERNDVDILKKIQVKLERSLEINDEIIYLSQHFDNVFCNFNDALTLNLGEYTKIFGNPSFQIQNEESLFKLFLFLYSKSIEYAPLFQFANFSNISNELIKQFINTFDFHSLDSNIWAKICSSMLKQDSPENSQKSTIECCAFHCQPTDIQRWFHCKTCEIIGENKICEQCILNCHKTHDVYFSGTGTSICCCGSGQTPMQCQCLPKARCTYSITGNKPIEQRFYNCKTCGMTSVCENCAFTCHKSHPISYAGKISSFCSCPQTGKCTCSNSRLQNPA